MESADNSQPPKGLPPVVPPSGRFIAQLFVVPGLIVAGAVAILVGFSWLAGGPRTPAAIRDSLRDPNPERRWRTASDLAQVIQRDPQLASDPEFGLELADLLRQSMAEFERMQRPKPDDSLSATQRANKVREYLSHRSFIQYLAACLGHMSVPIGAPVLADLASRPISNDAKSDALIRRQAAWALATLGSSKKKYTELSTEKKEAILQRLDQLADDSPRGTLAKQTAEHLRTQSPLGVVPALVKCSADSDPFLRQQAGFALTFWNGSPDEKELIEQTLLRLARDDGRGLSIEIGEND